MNMEQLAYFLHVAESGSINSAAQKFYMTQQAISASIKKMEAELNTPLITRSNKGVKLTPQGHIFAEHAKNLIERYELAVNDLEKFNASQQNLQGNLSIFSASVFTNIFLLETISKFKQIHPNIQIQIIDVDSKDLFPYILEQYCDIAFLSAGKSYIDTTLNKHKDKPIRNVSLMEDSIVLCMRPDNLLFHTKPEDVCQQAATQQFKFKYSTYQTLTEKNFTQNVFSASVSNSSNVELHKKLISEGLAITFMPQKAYEYEFHQEGFVCIPVKNSNIISHCLLYYDSVEHEQAQLIQAFLEFFQKQFQQKFGITPMMK